MATYDYEKVANATVFEWLEDGSQPMVKRAEDAINSFTRLKVREDGIHRKITPFLPLSNDELDRDITDKPIKWVDKEPDSPAALSTPFATLPINVYIKGPRYRILFQRILTPNFTKDISELRTWYMDIRQILSDNSIKDMLYEEDRKFFAATNVCMGGSANVTAPLSGVVQWATIPGGVTRDGSRAAFQILPSGPTHLEVKKLLLNNVTIQEYMKWGRDEVGGDAAEDMFFNGWSKKEVQGTELIITIKRDLVPDDSLYMWPDEKFIGKAFTLEDTTMHIKREAFMISWFCYEELGSAYGNTATPTRADLT